MPESTNKEWAAPGNNEPKPPAGESAMKSLLSQWDRKLQCQFCDHKAARVLRRKVDKKETPVCGDCCKDALSYGQYE